MLCVQEENCTLTIDDPGINTKSCKGYMMEECDCVQRRSVNFEFDCHCCKAPARQRRDVSLEAMFGLKSYEIPTDPPKTEAPKPATHFQKLRLHENDCGKLKLGNSTNIKPGVATSTSEISSVTIRATHATTAVNCWNLCRFNILSETETCTAVGFIEENSKKFINDCYILSESPVNSTSSDNSVDIYEMCF
ncbi:hypothetical protein CAEBREN_22139 [Caenorhabditis brenneri]|uniref:Uncharacterized protein n=1 Tax=Caenorhabditis brenneri TaxID=135651 RepID=G0M6N4_CAEBE|nr:hypothetical protein CAEBREN_22139 [Caenorhabditis brenneri]